MNVLINNQFSNKITLIKKFRKKTLLEVLTTLHLFKKKNLL